MAGIKETSPQTAENQRTKNPGILTSLTPTLLGTNKEETSREEINRAEINKAAILKERRSKEAEGPMGMHKEDRNQEIKEGRPEDPREIMIPKRINISSLVLYVSMLCGIFVLQSCDNRDYLSQKNFDKVCWSYSDPLEFSLDINGKEELGLFLQFTPEYAYQNIYLQLTYTGKTGESQEVLLNQRLSDKLGNWEKELSGGYYTFELPEAFQLDISQAGTYTFSLAQYMREDNLCGIEKIGVLRP